MKISKKEYEILTKVMFLLSDKFMADKYPEFREEHNIDDEETMEELKKIVDEWECMP
jgi:benzoyl-CoA reductase/2-hydroxyglutaryl-CoA dehydratase subunit BcrC/BadD/HgdB